jgi:Big-like domain-containing protein/calcineurin-like phosphoesterase family protein
LQQGTFRLFLVLIVMAVAATLAPNAGAAPASATFNPVADAYTRSDSASSNFGRSTVLRVDNSPVSRSYLRFNVQGLSGSVTKATLRVFSNISASSSGVDLRSVGSTTWGETTLNHSNAPAVGTSIASHVGAFQTAQWISFDAGQLVRGNGLVSMALTTTSSTSRGFQAREDTAHQPQLVVETGDTTAPAVTMTAPADGARTNDSTPAFGGAAGTVADDSATVRVRIYSGSTLFGIPVATVTTIRSGGSWSVSASSALADGTYTAQAEQSDASGNTGFSAPRGFTVDTVAPAVSLTAPADGSSTTDTTPALGGAAGTAPGDSATVAVSVYGGTSASGSPLQSLSATSSGGAWSVDAAPALPDGTYTAQAAQLDDLGNRGVSAATTFTVASTPVEPPPPGDTTAPAVTLTAPADGSSTADTTPTFSGAAGAAAGDSPTVTVKVYGGTTASGSPVQTVSANRSGDAWSVDASPALSPRVYTAQAEQSDDAGNRGVSSASTLTVVGDPVLLAAGDIACDPTSGSFNGGLGSATSCRQQHTSDLLVGESGAEVLALGDNQYENGALANYQQSFDPAWGRVKSRIHPVPGNHEYGTENAAGYFDYFNGAGNLTGPAGERGKGYYSFEVGSWHVIALNSSCSAVGGCGVGSPQEQWLRADLAAHPSACTLAYWHHPLFSSGPHGNSAFMGPIWQALYDAGADVVLSGHDHEYERFAPQSASGAADPVRGIREFVVGTGGRSHYTLGTPQPNSAVRSDDTFGVLKLTLRDNGYDWRFLPEAGRTFTDSGSDVCDGATTDAIPPSAPSGLTATVASGTVALGWTASTDDDGVAGYRIFRDGTQIATSPTPSYTDSAVQPGTTYGYHVVAYDAAGNVSPDSNTATVTTSATTQALTLGPTDDASIYSASTATNYGSATSVEVDNSPVKNFLLKFSVSGVGARTVTSAKLRLHAVDPSPSGGDFHRVAGTAWTEGSLTWANAPVADAAVVSSLGKVVSGSWYELDVTPLVRGDGVVSLRVTSTSSDGADYSSKEGGAGFAPQLVLTVG